MRSKLYFFTLTLFVITWGTAIVVHAQTDRERLATIEQWIKSVEADRGQRISEFESLKAMVTVNTSRLARLETQVENLEWWMKAIATAIGVQFLNMLYRIGSEIRHKK